MAKILFVLLFIPLLGFSENKSVFEKLIYTQNDERFAGLILSFFQNLENGIYDKRTILILKTMVEKDSAFKEYQPLINLSLDLNCKDLIINPNKPSNPFSNHWIKNLKKFCRLDLLNQISKGKLDKENEDLFYFSLNQFLKGESSKTFISFISSINKNKELGPRILDLIAKSILFSKIVPSEEILQQLELNRELTAFLQSEKLFVKNQEKIFLNEFKKIINNVLANPSNNLQSPNNPATNFLKSNQSFLSADGIYKSLRIIGYDQLRTNNKEKALEVYRMCSEFSPPDKKLESHFFLIWPSIFTNNFPEAVRIIKQSNMIENFDSYPSNMKFWIAYSLQKNNDLILAKSFYERLVGENLFDYYSILSMKSLKSLGHMPESKSFFGKHSIKNLELKSLQKQFTSKIIRAFLWLDSGREDFYKMEIDGLLNTDFKYAVTDPSLIEKENFKSWVILNLLALLNQKKYYLNTFKLAFDSIDKNYLNFSLPAIKTLFPMEYFSKIKEIESGVDPIIILSLIRQESAFNPRARSIAGAKGLMQIMPQTALTLNSRIKKNQLDDPDINLTLGILYLEKLLNKYDGDLIQTLSAYNAGERKLGIWMKDYFLNQDPVVMVESIPYEETRNYVKLIYRNIFFYKYLTNDPSTFIPLEESFKVITALRH